MTNESKPKVSALAMAKRSDEYATVAWTPDDVRRLRPAWSPDEARQFLQEHQAELAHMVLEVGRRALAALIAEREKEARYD